MSNVLFAVGFKTNDGRTLYYTGRSGEGYLSEDKGQAFYGYNEEYATTLGYRMRRNGFMPNVVDSFPVGKGQ